MMMKRTVGFYVALGGFVVLSLGGMQVADAKDAGGLIVQPEGAQALEMIAGQDGARLVLEAARTKAINEVVKASSSRNPFYRANAIEAASYVDERMLPMLQLGLSDKSTVVRYASLVLVGKHKIKSLGESAKGLLKDPDQSVRAAAMFASARCGMDVDASPLAGMLMSRDVRLRGNVAMLLGLMGNKSAIPMLADMSQAKFSAGQSLRDVEQIQFAEAMVRLGREEAMDSIRVRVYHAGEDESVRVLAISTLGKLGDGQMTAAFKPMLKDPNAHVRLAAAISMGELGSVEGRDVLLTSSTYGPADVEESVQAFLDKHGNSAQSTAFRNLLVNPKAMEIMAGQIRGQSAFGLGLMGDIESARRLTALLDDPDQLVRLSASAALLKSLKSQ